jgi:dienelactone hydrolase
VGGTIRARFAIALTLWAVASAPLADPSEPPLELVAFESAAQQLLSGVLAPGDRIQGSLAKPAGAGPFAAIIVLHGCAGMHDTTKRKLANDLVAQSYAVLFVDSYSTRGIDHACTSNAVATFYRRRQDAYGALVHLANQPFVDPLRVGAVGFSAGAWVTLSLVEPRSFEPFLPPTNLRLRAAAAFYPPCKQAVARPEVPTLILAAALDAWTPAADCYGKVGSWGKDGPSVELVVYPGAYHGFYYPHLQPGTTMFGHWLAFDRNAADDATRRLLRFLDRHLK